MDVHLRAVAFLVAVATTFSVVSEGAPSKPAKPARATATRKVTKPGKRKPARPPALDLAPPALTRAKPATSPTPTPTSTSTSTPPPTSTPTSTSTSTPTSTTTTQASLTLAPDESPARKRGWQTAGIVGLGVGGAALVTGGVLVFLAAHDRETLAVRCPQDRCDEREREAFERGQARADAATIVLASGAAITAASLGVILFAPRETKPSSPALELRTAGAGMVLSGRFQ